MVKATPDRRDRQTRPRKFGAHMSIAGGYDLAIRAARAVDFQTVQLFTKNNNQWKAAAISPEHAAAFRLALAETGIVDPVAHTSYLINLGSPDKAIPSARRRSNAMNSRESSSTPVPEHCRRHNHSSRLAACGRGRKKSAWCTDRPASRSVFTSATSGTGCDHRPGNDRRTGDKPGLSLRAPPGYPPASGAPRTPRGLRGCPAMFSQKRALRPGAWRSTMETVDALTEP